MELRVDYIYTDHKNAVDWVDLRLTPNGVTLPDGRPQFFEVDPLLPGCNATFNGLRLGFSNAGTNGGPCDDVGNANQDIPDDQRCRRIDNLDLGTTRRRSLILQTGRLSISSLGYAYLDAEVGNPVNSSTAGSSYEEVAKITLNNNTLGPALWANEHNIVLRASFKHYFFENHPTSIGLFFQRRSGRPFSYTYEDDTVEDLFGDSDDEESVLLYVPTGPTDPLMDFTTNLGGAYTQQDVDDFFRFLDESGLSAFAGGIAPKNGFNSSWSSDLDLRIQQDIPLWKEHELQLFFDIENVLNLFSDSNNLKRFADTGDIQEGVRVLQLDDGVTGVYEVEDIFFEGTDLDTNDSLYRIQLGIRYRF